MTQLCHVTLKAAFAGRSPLSSGLVTRLHAFYRSPRPAMSMVCCQVCRAGLDLSAVLLSKNCRFPCLCHQALSYCPIKQVPSSPYPERCSSVFMK